MGYYADSRSNSIDCRNWRTLISIARSPRLTAILWRLRFVDSSCRSISNSFVLTDSEVFQKTYMTQPPAAGTICWDEFLQLTIVLSVCIGFIQTDAFLYFPKTSSYLGRNSSSHPGGSAPFPAFETGDVAPPPLTLSPPQDTLTYWEEDIHAYGMRSYSPSQPKQAMQTSMLKWESSSFPAGDFLEQTNQKEERNVHQIQK